MYYSKLPENNNSIQGFRECSQWVHSLDIQTTGLFKGGVMRFHVGANKERNPKS